MRQGNTAELFQQAIMVGPDAAVTNAYRRALEKYQVWRGMDDDEDEDDEDDDKEEEVERGEGEEKDQEAGRDYGLEMIIIIIITIMTVMMMTSGRAGAGGEPGRAAPDVPRLRGAGRRAGTAPRPHTGPRLRRVS
jgi:hypothetical protein